MREIASAEYVSLPKKEHGLFKGRPWVVSYRSAVRSDGKKIPAGMRAFRLKREAAAFAFSICPVENDIPF